MKVIKVSDLAGDNSILYCLSCHGEYSANKHDYWNYSLNHEFKCCDEPMLLVTKTITYKEVE